MNGNQEAAQAPSAVEPVDVVLVSMPFVRRLFPSLGLSLLQAELRRQGFRSVTRYYSLRFVARIGRAAFQQIGIESINGSMPGEWLFAAALFDPPPKPVAAYLREVVGHPPEKWYPNGRGPDEELLRHLSAARAQVAGFLDECLADVLRRRPAVVGFTSVFEQHLPSLALARRIKAHLPQTVVVIGGANCEGVMGFELARQFPFVDAVVSGQGEQVFPELVRRAVAGAPVAQDWPGVYTRENTREHPADGRYANTPTVTDLDAIPFPDYDDFLNEFRNTPVLAGVAPVLLMQTSRGCWWGQKQHCTFCGLNGATMAFRRKSAARVLAEIDYLTGRYPGYPIAFADNILDMGHFRDLVPALAARRPRLPLYHLDVKANLNRAQLTALRDAGVATIEAGIESLSSPVLRLMRKGVSGLQNIQLLKWCRELGLRPEWQLIWGFPGEPPDEYARLVRLIPWLTHLPPPDGGGPFRLDRFSPNFFAADQFGLVDLEPFPAYFHLYPFAREVVANLAYCFTFRYRTPQDWPSYIRPLWRPLLAWQRQHAHSHLFQTDAAGELTLWDQRPAARQDFTVLMGLARRLYLACASIQGLNQLRRQATEELGREATAEEIEEVLRPLLEAGLMVREGDAFLSLALPLAVEAPLPAENGADREPRRLEVIAPQSPVSMCP
jgi:ribosomal peptide maturation radical SAM protein 1